MPPLQSRKKRFFLLMILPIPFLGIWYLMSGLNIVGFLLLLLSYLRMGLAVIGIDLGVELASVSDINVPPDFIIEEVYEVPISQGSWVSLTSDEEGNLYAADQVNKGIFKINPSKIGSGSSGTEVVKIKAPLLSAQGMVWVDGTLYASHNGKDSGVWKLSDTDKDGIPDKQEKIFDAGNDGEHGLHGLVADQKKENLYFMVGNMIAIPDSIEHFSMPPTWQNDNLIPMILDPSGLFKKTPVQGGWLAEIALVNNAENEIEEHEVTVKSVGFRNAYDMAVNQSGDIFTFDADMEWDMGLPWYRPARLNHVVSGADYGWRNGSSKWPEYFADSLPATLNIGPGSPTGMVFGYGANFPIKWKEALYVLDWTYGTIWAVVLEEKGASYSATIEPFVAAGSLPVTDAIIGSDGAFYFTVGGRAMSSKLYRVAYVGSDVSPSEMEETSNELITLRNALEGFHHAAKDVSTVTLDTIWTNLANEDRYVRHAALVALMNQNFESWEGKLNAEVEPAKIVAATIALAKQDGGDFEVMITRLLESEPSLGEEQLYLDWLRAISLTYLRKGNAQANELDSNVIEKLEAKFPTKIESINRELVKLLVYLDSQTVVRSTMVHLEQVERKTIPNWRSVDVLNQSTTFFGDYGGTAKAVYNNMPPEESIHYAYVLRVAKSGWDLELRKRYFEFFVRAAQYPGGSSYLGFLKTIRKEAVKNTDETIQKSLDGLINLALERELDFEIIQPEGPGRNWEMSQAIAAAENLGATKRSFEKGRSMYVAVGCAGCHQFNGQGGAVGPDLSTVASKFSIDYLLESIIVPNKAVSSQYQETIPMPPMLINSLNEEELLDLIAYMMSGGDPEHTYFK